MKKFLFFALYSLLISTIQSQSVEWIKSETYAYHWSDCVRTAPDYLRKVNVGSYWKDSRISVLKYEEAEKNRRTRHTWDILVDYFEHPLTLGQGTNSVPVHANKIYETSCCGTFS